MDAIIIVKGQVFLAALTEAKEEKIKSFSTIEEEAHTQDKAPKQIRRQIRRNTHPLNYFFKLSKQWFIPHSNREGASTVRGLTLRPLS